jgi:hypothetical protein
MGLLAIAALGVALYPHHASAALSDGEPSFCAMGQPTLKMTYVPGGLIEHRGRIAISGPPAAMAKLFAGRPALIARNGEEIPLEVVERPTDLRDPTVAIFAPRTPLAPHRVYGLKSWWGSRVERRPASGTAPPAWNGTIEALEAPGGRVSLRFSPAVGPFVRVVAGAQRTLIAVSGRDVELGCPGCVHGLDLRGRTAVTVTTIDPWGRESAERTFDVVARPRMRGHACRAGEPARWRVVSTPLPEVASGLALLERIFLFVALPFFLSYGAVSGVMALARRRRRRIIAEL